MDDPRSPQDERHGRHSSGFLSGLLKVEILMSQHQQILQPRSESHPRHLQAVWLGPTCLSRWVTRCASLGSLDLGLDWRPGPCGSLGMFWKSSVARTMATIRGVSSGRFVDRAARHGKTMPGFFLQKTTHGYSWWLFDNGSVQLLVFYQRQSANWLRRGGVLPRPIKRRLLHPGRKEPDLQLLSGPSPSRLPVGARC